MTAELDVIRNSCDGTVCTKACLKHRIVQYIEEEGYLPSLLSSCKYSPGSPYWVWVNRYYGDLVVIDVDAPAYPHIKTGWQSPAVIIPIDIVTQVAKWLDCGQDLTSMALVQRSWCYPAQVELFRAVILKCPVRAQLFVEAFVRNLGPGNPLTRKGANRLPLERFVRHIFLDVPENFSQAEFYGNLATILPLLENVRSLYIVMRRWNDYVWKLQLGKYLPEHAPPSLQRLCIQIAAGDPDPKLFECQSDVNQWRAWFSEWKHLQIAAFICEDTWWWGSSETTGSQAREATEGIVRQWLANSSLQRFEMWSGAENIQLSPQFQVAYARFHAFDKSESTRHRCLFERGKTTGAWTLLPSSNLVDSAISKFDCEGICTTSCWICQAVEGVEDLEDVASMIMFWNDMKEEGWNDRVTALRPWSKLDSDHTYNLLI